MAVNGVGSNTGLVTPGATDGAANLGGASGGGLREKLMINNAATSISHLRFQHRLDGELAFR